MLAHPFKDGDNSTACKGTHRPPRPAPILSHKSTIVRSLKRSPFRSWSLTNPVPISGLGLLGWSHHATSADFFLAPLVAMRKILLSLDTFSTLVVNNKAFPSQKDMQTLNVVPAFFFCEFTHTQTKCPIPVLGFRMPDDTAIGRPHTTNPPLRTAVSIWNETHSTFSGGELQKFFPITSLSMTISRACPATSRLRREFSSSS